MHHLTLNLLVFTLSRSLHLPIASLLLLPAYHSTLLLLATLLLIQRALPRLHSPRGRLAFLVVSLGHVVVGAAEGSGRDASLWSLLAGRTVLGELRSSPVHVWWCHALVELVRSGSCGLVSVEAGASTRAWYISVDVVIAGWSVVPSVVKIYLVRSLVSLFVRKGWYLTRSCLD